MGLQRFCKWKNLHSVSGWSKEDFGASPWLCTTWQRRNRAGVSITSQHYAALAQNLALASWVPGRKAELQARPDCLNQNSQMTFWLSKTRNHQTKQAEELGVVCYNETWPEWLAKCCCQGNEVLVRVGLVQPNGRFYWSVCSETLKGIMP